MFLMGSSCWADKATAMPSKAVTRPVNEEYIIIGVEWMSRSQQSQPMASPSTSSTATDNDGDTSRSRRRHQGLKQEGKGQENGNWEKHD